MFRQLSHFFPLKEFYLLKAIYPAFFWVGLEWVAFSAGQTYVKQQQEH